MNKDKKEKGLLYINNAGELLIWLIIVLIFVAFSSLGFIFKEKNSQNDYRVFLPDADGLIVGSSVRMMGVEVGHVVKIKPVKDEVYVKFILTNPDVYIPQGTEVTVEFNGMAGSKSLELYLPNRNTYRDNDTPMMKVNSPKRLHDAAKLLGEMYNKITSIIYSISSFGNKLNDAHLELNTKNGTTTDTIEFLQYSDNFLDDWTKKANEIKTNIEGFRKNGN